MAMPHFLRGFRQAQVDLACFLGPAGHGTDQDGSSQSFAEQAEACVDAVQIQFGQRLVDKVIVFESGRQRGADILFQIDLDVVGFSLVNGRNFCHRVVFLTVI